MNSQVAPERTALAYIVGILGSFLIIAGLVWAMLHYTKPAPLGEDRALVRARTLAELRAAETEALDTPTWLDQTKGLVRLRIEDAMRIVEHDWGANPAAGRSNLIERVEKATAVPPKAPEKPSQFE